MIIAYIYTNPMIEITPDSFFWGCEIEAIYQDIGERQQLVKLIRDCEKNAPSYLLIRSLSEFGNSLDEVTKTITVIEELGIEIIAIDEDYNSSKFKIINNSKTKEKLLNIWNDIRQKIHQKKLLKSHGNNRLNIYHHRVKHHLVI